MYSIAQALGDKEDHDAICLNELAPSDCYQWRHWINETQLPFKTNIYCYSYDNHPDQVDETTAARLVLKLNKRHKLFAKREMRKDFLYKYYSLAKVFLEIFTNPFVQLQY